MFRVKTSPADLGYFTPCFSLLRRGNKAFRFWIEDFGLRICEVKSLKVCLVIVLFVTSFTSSCRQPAANEVATTNVPMRIVRDDLDREILVPTKITRVVSTAPSVTEMIFAAGAGDRLVGVTTFCNYPEEAKSIAKIGDTMNPNMESIVALKPDVVFVSTASQIEAFTKTLEQNGIAVYVMNPSEFESIFSNLKNLGSLFETEKQANELVNYLQKRVDAVKAIERYELNQKVFVQISKQPLFSIGRESFMTALINAAGAVSVTADIATAYPSLSLETAATLNPDVIILSDSEDNREPNDAFKNSKAVKMRRVYKIDAELIARPGPRLVDALEQIARVLHTHRS